MFLSPSHPHLRKELECFGNQGRKLEANFFLLIRNQIE